jgi:hypothetical protein
VQQQSGTSSLIQYTIMLLLTCKIWQQFAYNAKQVCMYVAASIINSPFPGVHNQIYKQGFK